MKAFRLFRIFGIDVKIHWTFAFLPAFTGWLYYRDFGLEVALRAVTLVSLVFLCVLAHELTHSFEARRFGIRVPQIVLYPIGGVASMQRIPRDPRQEFTIAIAGPLFNFALALVLFVPFYFLLGKEALFSPSLESWPRTFANLFWMNPVLGLFNLVRAFPMDGGRVLRSVLARRMSYVKATRISVLLGYGFAIIFALVGILYRHWMLTLIGVFIFISGSDEQRHVAFEEWMRSHEKNA